MASRALSLKPEPGTAVKRSNELVSRDNQILVVGLAALAAQRGRNRLNGQLFQDAMRLAQREGR